VPIAVAAQGLANLETQVVGRWIATMPDNRQHQLDVLTIKPDGAAEAAYSFHEFAPVNAGLTVRQEQGQPVLAWKAPSGVSFMGRVESPQQMRGTRTTTDGKSFPILFRRASPAAAIFNAGTPTAADLENQLFGSWLVQVGRQERTRNLEIRGIAAKDGRFTVDGAYGWSDGEIYPVAMTAELLGAGLRVDLTTPAKSRIQGRLTAPDRIEGVFSSHEGKMQWLEAKLVADEVGASAGGRAKELTLIYISASNCKFCKDWEFAFGSEPHMAKRALLASPEGKVLKFRQIDTTHYASTARDADWPEDLRWVRQKTYVGGGTPRFVLVADKVVIANVTRARNMERQILPKVRTLAGLQ
jgi:hypothetical protein